MCVTGQHGTRLKFDLIWFIYLFIIIIIFLIKFKLSLA